MPTQEELQRLHEERLANLERDLAEARHFIAVNAQNIEIIRRMLGLPPTYKQGQSA